MRVWGALALAEQRLGAACATALGMYSGATLSADLANRATAAHFVRSCSGAVVDGPDHGTNRRGDTAGGLSSGKATEAHARAEEQWLGHIPNPEGAECFEKGPVDLAHAVNMNFLGHGASPFTAFADPALFQHMQWTMPHVQFPLQFQPSVCLQQFVHTAPMAVYPPMHAALWAQAQAAAAGVVQVPHARRCPSGAAHAGVKEEEVSCPSTAAAVGVAQPQSAQSGSSAWRPVGRTASPAASDTVSIADHDDQNDGDDDDDDDSSERGRGFPCTHGDCGRVLKTRLGFKRHVQVCKNCWCGLDEWLTAPRFATTRVALEFSVPSVWTYVS